jgi:hypothetical protein
MDRGYLDFERLYRLHQSGGFFVTRAKRNMNFQRRHATPVDHSTGLICDQRITLNNYYAAQDYPQPLRRVRYKDPVTNKSLVFLTNHFGIPALSVCALYKSRWQVELFFKWIKRHLRIKRFFGTFENAVKSQVWIAVATYVLVAIVKKRLKLELSLHTMLQVLSVTPFEKIPLIQLFSDIKDDPKMYPEANQLILL